jgi:hypothetical protein
MSFRAGARAGSAEQDPTIRGPRTWQVGSRCLARVKGQGRIGLENLEIAGLESGSRSTGGRRGILRWIPHQAKTSVGATRVSVSDRRTPMRVQLRPRANERWIPHRAREPGTRAGLRGKLRRRAEDAREMRRRDEHYRPLIPVVMATPWLACARAQGMRTGARRRADEQACLKRDQFTKLGGRGK